jgi:transposase
MGCAEDDIMIQVAAGTKVYLACRPVSMRYGFDGLAAQVGPVLAADPFSGHVFIFRSKRADYLKILYYDGTGLCLFAKRLERGKFVWPPIVDGGMLLTPAQMALLIEAIDWRRFCRDHMIRPPKPVGGRSSVCQGVEMLCCGRGSPVGTTQLALADHVHRLDACQQDSCTAH